MGPKEHLHEAILTVGRRRETRVVLAACVLNGDVDTVIAFARITEVVVLEVEASFGEPILVGYVVDSVHNVEGVGTSDVRVALLGW